MRKIILIILDGLGDRPIEQYGGLTPLEYAFTPNMDRLAKNGICGLMDVMEGKTPESDEAHLTLFGYNLKKYYTGRGPIEALGVGMNLMRGDIALRANLASVDKNLIVIDRRAQRIRSTKEFVEAVNKMEIDGVKFFLKPGTEHRAVIVMRGENLNDKISDSDPHKVGVKVKKVRPLNESKNAKFTASVLNKFLAKSHEILNNLEINKKRIEKGLLPGNYFLTRGAGHFRPVPSFKRKYGMKACCIAGAGLYKGIGKLVGMSLINLPGATGSVRTDIRGKFIAAKKAIKKFDFVFVHVKGCDIFGHDGNFEGKRHFIEKIDKAMQVLLGIDVPIVITADHSTPCECKGHSNDPVPLLISGPGIRPDTVKNFGERYCKFGTLGKLKGKEFMKKIMEIA